MPHNPVLLPGKSESSGVKLGEGKPENQNAAVIFCFNEALQTVDMNQVRRVQPRGKPEMKHFYHIEKPDSCRHLPLQRSCRPST